MVKPITYHPIDQANLNNRLTEIFGEDRGKVERYIKGEDSFAFMKLLSRDEAKWTAFKTASDKVIGGLYRQSDFLTPRERRGNFESDNPVIDYITMSKQYVGDSVLSLPELREIVNSHKMGNLMDKMGPDLTEKWERFTIGIINGIVDMETSRKQYDPEEVSKGPFPKHLREEIRRSVNLTENAALQFVSDLMDSRCLNVPKVTLDDFEVRR